MLSLDRYFDEKYLALERRTILRNYGGFIGLESMVPNVNDYYVLPHTNNMSTLVRTQEGLRLISNHCRHRDHPLLEGTGNANHIVCLAHRWAYHMDGSLLSSNGISEVPQTESLCSGQPPIFNSHSILTCESEIDKAARESVGSALIDYVLLDYSVRQYHANWKEYVDVFNDNYHIPTIHPGFRRMVKQSDIKWDVGDRYISCTMGWDQKFYQQDEDPLFREYADRLLDVYGEKEWNFGARWVTLFPNTLIELYQDYLLLVVVTPRTVCLCDRHGWVYGKGAAMANRTMTAAFVAAIDSTEAQDAEILQTIHKSRFELWQMGREHNDQWSHSAEKEAPRFHRYVEESVRP